MSFRAEKFLSFDHSGIPGKEDYLEGKNHEDLSHLFLEILHGGIHGFCFSPYDENQKPGNILTEYQISRRMEILKPYTGWIRSFSCTEGNELIPEVAKKMGLKTLVGAWLSKDEEKNREEIDGLIRMARKGMVDIAAVGNEVLYRSELTEEQLIAYLETVKKEIPGIPVGYVDAYYEFVERPELTRACDLILCNCYPFWEGTAFPQSLPHMQMMFQMAKQAGRGKRVIITETGWPGRGESLGNAEPSLVNAMNYFINTQLWAMDAGIEVFYFSSFDESWKKTAEGEVGAYWGIWDSNGKLKYGDGTL